MCQYITYGYICALVRFFIYLFLVHLKLIDLIFNKKKKNAHLKRINGEKLNAIKIHFSIIQKQRKKGKKTYKSCENT